MYNVECWTWNAAMREFYTPTDSTEEHRCHAGCLPITQIAPSARQMNTDSSQAVCNLSVEIGEICGRRQPLRPTLSPDVLCNILVQKLCGDFRWNRQRNRGFSVLGDANLRRTLTVSHLSSCDTYAIAPRKTIYRGSKDEVSTLGLACFATANI